MKEKFDLKYINAKNNGILANWCDFIYKNNKIKSQILNLKSINCFVGVNNFGKSRLIRGMCDFIDTVKIEINVINLYNDEKNNIILLSYLINLDSYLLQQNKLYLLINLKYIIKQSSVDFYKTSLFYNILNSIQKYLNN